ncbi:MAG: T9SS type A sorting domain-containing protein [Candidatus Neomarinimicrobiota bacterium]
MKTNRNGDWKQSGAIKIRCVTFTKSPQKSQKEWLFWSTVICYFWIALTFKFLPAQSVIIQGTVTTSNLIPVKYASITFTNQNDTTQKYSAVTDTSGYYRLTVTTGIDHFDYKLPSNIELSQNYPNPFSASTSISYKLNIKSDVEVAVYDLLGREIKKLVTGVKSPGEYFAHWDGCNKQGQKVAAGIYFYRLRAGKEVLVGKMLFKGYGSSTSSSSAIKNIYSHRNKLDKRNDQQDEWDDSILYTIRIENTNETYPRISTREFYEISIRQDTIISLSVKEITHYNMNLYVGNYGYDQIYVIDTDDDTVIDTLKGFISVKDVVPTKGGKKLYVSTFKYSVYPYDTTYPAVVYSVNLQTGLKNVIYNGSPLIKMTSNGVPLVFFDRQIGTLDTLTDAITFFDSLDVVLDSPQPIVFDPNAPIFYTLNSRNQFFAYNYQNQSIVRYFNSISQFYRMTISADGKYIYCSNGPIVEIVADSIVGWITANYRGSIAQTFDSQYLYVTDPGAYLIPEPIPSGHISIFNTRPDGRAEYTGYIDVNKAAGQAYTITDDIVIMPDAKKAYVSSYFSRIFSIDLEINEVVNVIRFKPRNINLRSIILGVK